MTENETVDFATHPNPRVRDLSYSRSRMRQLVDLTKGAFFDIGFGERKDGTSFADPDNLPPDQLEIYIADKPRGPGYVCDIVYRSDDLPVVVYAVLIDRGHGLEIGELELFRVDWGYDDGHGNWVDPSEYVEDEDDDEPAEPATLITSEVLRRIPLGRILTDVEDQLPDDSWRHSGVQVLGGPDLAPEDLTQSQRRALENSNGIIARRRGRPPLDDKLLIAVADAYLEEAARGRGAIARLAVTFDRPEPTIRDWIAAARRRGFLAPVPPADGLWRPARTCHFRRQPPQHHRYRCSENDSVMLISRRPSATRPRPLASSTKTSGTTRCTDPGGQDCTGDSPAADLPAAKYRSVTSPPEPAPRLGRPIRAWEWTLSTDNHCSTPASIPTTRRSGPSFSGGRAADDHRFVGVSAAQWLP